LPLVLVICRSRASFRPTEESLVVSGVMFALVAGQA
jgi:hypothetical protein